MNTTDKESRRIPIEYDNRTLQEKRDQELASDLNKSQSFPYDHTCSYDKLRGEKDPDVTDIESTCDAIPDFEERKKRIIEEAKKDIEICKKGTKQILDALGDFKPAEDQTWNEFLGERFNDAKRKFPDTSLVRAYNKYKAEVEEWMKQHSKLPKTIAKAMLLEEYPEEQKVPEYEDRPFGEKVFKFYTDKMLQTYIKKNADYGSSFDDLFDEFGMDSVLIRLKDKFNRIKSLTKPGQKQMVVDESVEDTLLDLANYCILTLVKLQKDKEEAKKK